MRLTLRTMLAYLDEMLEPAQSEEIGQKIQESEFARKLVHRTRDCVQRLRLGAPPVLGRGIGMDANTVAEYLENTLATERVPDLERVCLESDVHLAEVAACHQVLTLVLGEPAEVDRDLPADCRERLYGLIERADAPQHGKTPAAAAALPKSPAPAEPAPTAARMTPQRAKAEIPEYLREADQPTGRRLLLVALGIAVAAFVTLTVLALAGPRSFRELVARQMGFASQPAAPAANGNEKGGRASIASSEGNRGDRPKARPANANAQADAPVTETEQAAEPAEGGSDKPAESPDPTPADASPEKTPTDPTTDAGPPGAEDGAGGEAPAAATEPADPPDAPPNLPKPVGRYHPTERGVLLRYDPAKHAWNRLAPQSALTAGDELLALPAFTSQLSLAGGITVHLYGPSSIVLLAADAEGRPVVEVKYGRLQLLTDGKEGHQVVLRFGRRQGLVTFDDPESTAGVELRRRLIPGEDPARTPASEQFELQAVSGTLHWETEAIKAPDTVLILEDGHAVSVDQPPRADPTAEARLQLDRRAAETLEKNLKLDETISHWLKQFAESRRPEERSLAVRAAAYAGMFEPAVAALGNPDEKAAWTYYLDALQAALARGPDEASLVRAELVRAAQTRGKAEQGAKLYRMLWGYGPQQLTQGTRDNPAPVAAQLVDYLEHDQLEFRVLAYWNLKSITGKPLYFQPADAPANRSQAVRRWRLALERGEIKHATAPSAVPPRRRPEASPAPTLEPAPEPEG
jgi:hypothetical protein